MTDDTDPTLVDEVSDEDLRVRTVQAEAIKKYSLALLPTEKPHVSFSEISDWMECSWRHKLKHVDKIDLDKPGWALDFGTALHAACEHFLKTRKLDITIATDWIKRAWAEHSFDKLDEFLEQAKAILEDVPAFMDSEFEEWEYIDAEHLLYEPIIDHPHAFKGYIDGIISAVNRRGQRIIWLIDWKTTGWGWDRNKKSSPRVRAQLVYYKTFWSRKTGTPMKDIRCGFVLLKRSAKPGKHCELIPVSVGDVTTDRSLKVINNMFTSLERRMALKNKLNCRWCAYKGTDHCPGTAIVS